MEGSLTQSQTEILTRLASLLRARNENAREITQVIGRPALLGHLGEFVAASIFDIALAATATAKGLDGHFRSGPFAGKSVNIKWYAKAEGLLDVKTEASPDFYLVLAGPRGTALNSRGEARLWAIDSVFLFDSIDLLAHLKHRNVKIGVATSLIRSLWSSCEVFPTANTKWLLSHEQCALLKLFSTNSIGT